MLYPKNSATISVDPFRVIAFCVAWRDMAQFRSWPRRLRGGTGLREYGGR